MPCLGLKGCAQVKALQIVHTILCSCGLQVVQHSLPRDVAALDHLSSAHLATQCGRLRWRPDTSQPGSGRQLLYFVRSRPSTVIGVPDMYQGELLVCGCIRLVWRRWHGLLTWHLECAMVLSDPIP
jgi:hypothetical protein